MSKTTANREVALADFPTLGSYIETWQKALAENEWTPWIILGLATFLRFFLLGIKPPHFDEGINGWFVDQTLHNGFYKYDPTNYHGPLHFYVLLLSQTLFGRNVLALRLPVVLVSIACVWLTLKFEPFVGRVVSRLAALAMAVSPGFVFYGRYSIHEVWILFFTMLFFIGLFGLWKSGSANYLWCAGMGVTGMILSKETYILHVVCAIIAAGVCYFSTYFSKLDDAGRAEQRWTYVDLAVVIGTGVALIVAFYSGFFFHWTGVRGIFEAYKPWFKTGSQGHGHEKPWPYWLKLIARYEWPVLGGVVVSLFAIRFKNMSLRYLAIYGVAIQDRLPPISRDLWCRDAHCLQHRQIQNALVHHQFHLAVHIYFRRSDLNHPAGISNHHLSRFGGDAHRYASLLCLVELLSLHDRHRAVRLRPDL